MIKKFILTSLKFIFPIISFLCLLLIVISITTIYIRNNSKFYKIDKNIETLFLGDSHISHAINDDLIRGAKNLAKPAEAYYFTYHKLIFFTKENKNVKNIYLGYSYNSFSQSYDQFINGWFASNIGPSFFFILPLKEQLRTLYWNRRTIKLFCRNLLSVFYDHLNENYKRKTSLYNGFDNYYNESCINQDTIRERINFQYFKKNNTLKTLDSSRFNSFYFKKIIKYCYVNNLNLKLIATPIHIENYKRIPLFFKNLFMKKKELKLIDFTSYINDDCNFSPDGDHVNKIGSFKVTSALK